MEPKSSREKVRVGGLAFAPSARTRESVKKLGCTLFLGIDAWYEAGCPTKAVIYDHVGSLVDHKIPVLDAVYSMGIYHRMKGHQINIPEIKVPRRCFTAPPAVPHTDDGCKVLSKHGIVTISAEATAAASGHGKMSRGAGHRAKSAKQK